MKGTGLPIGKPVLLLIRPLFRKNLVLTEHKVMGPKLTQAEGFILGVGAKMFSCCGARHIPCRRSGFVICRPLPLATGGAPIAPHRRTGDRLWRLCECDLWGYLLDNDIVLKEKRRSSVAFLLERFYIFFNKLG